MTRSRSKSKSESMTEVGMIYKGIVSYWWSSQVDGSYDLFYLYWIFVFYAWIVFLETSQSKNERHKSPSSFLCKNGNAVSGCCRRCTHLYWCGSHWPTWLHYSPSSFTNNNITHISYNNPTIAPPSLPHSRPTLFATRNHLSVGVQETKEYCGYVCRKMMLKLLLVQLLSHHMR